VSDSILSNSPIIQDILRFRLPILYSETMWLVRTCLWENKWLDEFFFLFYRHHFDNDVIGNLYYLTLLYIVIVWGSLYLFNFLINYPYSFITLRKYNYAVQKNKNLDYFCSFGFGGLWQLVWNLICPGWNLWFFNSILERIVYILTLPDQFVIIEIYTSLI